MSTMSPEEINARMQALLTLDGYGGIIKQSETVAYWRMTSEDGLWIDVTFPNSDFWEYKRKGQKIEWKSGLGVPAQIKGMIETLDSDIMNIWGAMEWGKKGVEEVKEVIEMKDVITEPPVKPVDPDALDLLDAVMAGEAEPGTAEEIKEEVKAPEAKTPESRKYEPPKKEFQKPVNNQSKNNTGNNTTLLKIIENYIKNDLVQIFGDTGTGKTSISMQIANDARNEGRRVLYVDSEHNTTDDQATAVKANGIDYVYIPDFEEMYQYIRKIPSYDVVIVDSMGLPVLNLYATMGMRERGDALLKMIALTAFLKKYANQNKALIVVTNQPESDFNKDPNTARRPFGDKSQFNTKEIFRTVFAKGGRLENKTSIILKAYRSRSCGMDSRICSVEISDNGVKVIQ